MYSIILATYNRGPVVKENIDVLIRYYGAMLDAGKLEILVIDNNSRDNTAELIQSYASRYSTIRYCLETKQGLSHARNRGIAESNGDILIFLDDDVEVADTWLDSLVQPLLDDPTIGIVGGRVLPYGQPTPEWMPEKYYWLVGVIDFGTETKFTHYAPGGNMAIRKKTFDEIGLYNPELGRNAGRTLGGEEVEIQQKMLRKGYRILYSPTGLIYHKIAPKLNQEYVLTFAFNDGLSCRRIDRNLSKARYCLKSVYGWLSLQLFLPLRERAARNLEVKIRQRYFEGYLSAAN